MDDTLLSPERGSEAVDTRPELLIPHTPELMYQQLTQPESQAETLETNQAILAQKVRYAAFKFSHEVRSAKLTPPYTISREVRVASIGPQSLIQLLRGTQPKNILRSRYDKKGMWLLNYGTTRWASEDLRCDDTGIRFTGRAIDEDGVLCNLMPYNSIDDQPHWEDSIYGSELSDEQIVPIDTVSRSLSDAAINTVIFSWRRALIAAIKK